jgi:hypothetical protein
MSRFQTGAVVVTALVAFTVSALAQTANPVSPAPAENDSTRSDLGNPVGVRPTPPGVSEDAPPTSFLQAARGAVAAGRIGLAQENLERAESRLLVRSVPPSRAGQPSEQTLVAQIGDARRALGAGDRTRALQLIDTALANPEANAPVR